ncbi:MAG: glucuronate isomerase [Verrucomicrobiales bacterium]|jgi:glucuronate isomerase|nr:glucuronate isomerase [Verrucomicrobiales bacterium]
MKTFVTDDFLLQSRAARALYHEYAEGQPILDYHCHLPSRQIAENRRFRNLADLWLAGDHYKWRLMRWNGIDERYCTGDAPDYEKFLAFARTVPRALLNPIHHWTHLELLRYFRIDDLLDETTAPAIWAAANELLGGADFTARGLITRSGVRVICTTDDPADDLRWHRQLRADASFPTRVYPTFRPDRALAVARPEIFNAWVARLEAAADVDCATFADFLRALDRRHQYFHDHGCRLSDHGLGACPGDFADEVEAARIYATARAGRNVTVSDAEKFAGHLLLHFARRDAALGWAKQLHLGALRDNNTRLFQSLGPDVGGDSIGDERQAVNLSRYLARLDQERALPKIILYNLNPADNYLLATMAGNFQDGAVPGKIQFGSGWWFLDQKDGMEWQLRALAGNGLLSRFVGMLTDSRSFLSYTRHEYFRRVLCNVIGGAVERGEAPADLALTGRMVRDICYRNAADYFALPA